MGKNRRNRHRAKRGNRGDGRRGRSQLAFSSLVDNSPDRIWAKRASAPDPAFERADWRKEAATSPVVRARHINGVRMQRESKTFGSSSYFAEFIDQTTMASFFVERNGDYAAPIAAGECVRVPACRHQRVPRRGLLDVSNFSAPEPAVQTRIPEGGSSLALLAGSLLPLLASRRLRPKRLGAR